MEQTPQYGQQAQPYQQGYNHTSQTTVIVQQPQGAGPRFKNVRAWSSPVCGCFEDITSCLLGWFCLPCYECHLSMRMGESCCVPVCVPGAMIALRAKLRGEQGIQGSVCDDCITMSCCGPCATCQLARELNYIEQAGL
ncbi:cornifelin homolog A-like [Liolophura sinensis]|uniref:cornifelin homolog A-like n=1 Tax=Liolophura sinensis TaxID=3198878 RepID=UPI0031581EEC